MYLNLKDNTSKNNTCIQGKKSNYIIPPHNICTETAKSHVYAVYYDKKRPNQIKSFHSTFSGSEINPHSNNYTIMNNLNFPNSNEPVTIVNSGPYDYKLIFEGNHYPHSVNLTKLVFKVIINGEINHRIIFLSTGHSFGEISYISNFNALITKTSNINDLFTQNANLFYSIDNEFNDCCLISFGLYNINRENIFNFSNQNLIVNSILKNINIKSLELDTLIKNGHNTGESYGKAIINFSTDKYIYTSHNKINYYTFKINRKVVIVSTPFSSGIVVKGLQSKISKLNGNIMDPHTLNAQLEYHFTNTIKLFQSHDLFHNHQLDYSYKKYYKNYADSNSISVISMMGDSGAGFYKLKPDSSLEFLGINIGCCYMIILSEYSNPNSTNSTNSTNSPDSPIYWDNNVNKLVVGNYIIEEVHKSCQILPITDIENLFKSNPENIISEIIA